MLKDPDEALVERWRGGDEAAFTVLVTRYQRPLYNAAYRILGNVEDAADITQAVFLKVAERLDEYDESYRFFSWIYRITVNESLNLARRNGRVEPLEEETEIAAGESADPERQALAAELAGRIQKALMGMKVDDRVVLTLRHFSDCSYQEIATILKIEEKTVKSRLFEARQRLRELLLDFAAA